MPTPASVLPAIADAIDAHRDAFLAISREIWADPELGFEEHRAAARLTAPLAEAGFQVQTGLAGMDTAFRATWTGSAGGPTIAFLCEYDALKGLGHACGHNLIGTGGMLAGWALRQAWPDLPGRIQVVGTPAEEGGGGKVLMVDGGEFEEVDAAIMFHPGSGVSMVHRHALAAQVMDLEFRGRPAHAAAAPWDGVNALDAMIQFFVGVGLLRQQLRPDIRLHGVITDGGEAANVIPERAAAQFIVRAEGLGDHQAVWTKVEALARAAALATGCTLSTKAGPLYANRVNNMVMARAMERHLNRLGVPTEEPDPKAGVGSSDIGNVSIACPAIHPYVSIAEAGVGGHTEAFREASNSPTGEQRMLIAAESMAAVAAELFGDPEMLAAAKEEHRASLERLS